MAIGNLFDNRSQNPPAWREWSGDVSFRKEDIDYLVMQYNDHGEAKMTMNGETKQGKKGAYINVKLKELYQKDAASTPKAAPVGEPSPPTLTLDDL
jgi:hypothetical protein